MSTTISEAEASSLLYRAHPLVRIEPAGDGAWLLGREDRMTGHKVPAHVAALLVAAFAPGTADTLTGTVASGAAGTDPTPSLLPWLLRHGYLVPEGDDEAGRTTRWLESWQQNGWRAASRYHARTYGYPFETYEVDGSSAEDVRRMVAYNAARPDVDRARPRLADATRSHVLPEPAPELVGTPASGTVASTVGAQPLDVDRLAAVIALLARPVRVGKMPFPESADLLRKTSPSGGSRHPTEFYVITHGVAGMTDGIYQVAPVDGVMDSLDRLEGDPEVWARAAGAQTGDGPWALVLFSSYFSRNRYRYREPRTFRTVHMDVGHLMGTTEYLGLAHGWTVRHTQHLDGSGIAGMLGLDPHVEVPIAATLFSTTHEAAHADGEDS